MKVEVSFKPVETDKPTGLTLANVPVMTWARCRYGHHQVCKRFRDAKRQVWGAWSGMSQVSHNMLETFEPPPEAYEVLEILDRVRVLPPEQPPEPPAIRLSELDRQVWVKCQHYTDLHNPMNAHLRCHDGAGTVFFRDVDDVPSPIPAASPSDYVVLGKPIGQLTIKETDDE